MAPKVTISTSCGDEIGPKLRPLSTTGSPPLRLAAVTASPEKVVSEVTTGAAYEVVAALGTLVRPLTVSTHSNAAPAPGAVTHVTAVKAVVTAQLDARNAVGLEACP